MRAYHYYLAATVITISASIYCSLCELDDTASSGDAILPKDFEFDINCVLSTTSYCSSPSLSEIASTTLDSQDRNVIIRINVELLKLSEAATFKGLNSVSIYGNYHDLVCSSSGSGMTFQMVETVTIENLTIANCGTGWHINNSIAIMSAINLIKNGQITILGVTVANSNGSGLNIQRPKRNVTVRDSNFVSNAIQRRHPDQDTLGGNGVILFIAGNVVGQFSVFDNCKFIRNVANGRSYDFLSGQFVGGRGRGGGIIITFFYTAREATVIVTECTFERNNAFLGSGLSGIMNRGGLSKNKLIIQDSQFIRNGCIDKTRDATGTVLGIGGGVHLSFETNQNTDATDNKLSLVNVTFEQNCAVLGGGTFFFSVKYQTMTTGSILFDRCTWSKNFAHVGSAVDLTPNIFVRAEVGHLPKPEFKDCRFHDNSVRSSQDLGSGKETPTQRSYGSGTLYSSLMHIRFIENVQFTNNTGSGIIIVNAEVNLVDSNASFAGNTGVQGGALLLIGVSAMVVGAYHSYTFEENLAYDRGGAIYSRLVDNADILMSRSCFLRYLDETRNRTRIQPSKYWNASLVFRRNRANEVGHSIFTTSILPCQVVSRSTSTRNMYEVLNVSEIFQAPGIVIDSEIKENHIATEGIDFDNISDVLYVVPGHEQDLEMRILDDLGQPVNVPLTAFLQTNSTLKVASIISHALHLDIKLSGQEGTRDKLFLQTLGSRKLTRSFEVQLLNCPPGYKLDHGICECDFNSYVGITKCENNVAYLVEGFWAGYIMTTDNMTLFATSICPVGYCEYKEDAASRREVKLPSSPADLEEAVCGKGRKGILCGACAEGYTAYYHSPKLNCNREEPFSCKLGWLFYILSELVPVTLLFVLVLAFNINFTTGAVNSFIFFSQLQDTLHFDASGVITYGPAISALTRIYQLFYGFFNLDLFNIEPLSYCIWKNASVLDMLCFKYVTVAFSLLLVLSVILFMKYCAARCLGRYYSISALRNSAIHGLSGFLVLCYTQTVKVSFNIFYSQTLSISSNITSHVNSLSRVWFSGDRENFGLEHIPYALPSLVIVVVIGGVPPIILLSYPLLNKVLTFLKLNNVWGLRCLNHLNRLKPLLDSFQGSFKDEYRFFAGLYFFYRWIGLIIYTYSSTFSGFYTTVSMTLVVILVFHSVCQPYQKKWHNILDTLVIANLIIINGISSLNYYLVRVDSGRHNHTETYSAIQLVFIYLPILYITVYTAAWILKKIFPPKKKDEEHPQTALTQIRKKNHSSSFVDTEEAKEDGLPYRLLGHEEDESFTNSNSHHSMVVDSY